MKKHNAYIFIGIVILLSWSPKNNVSKNREIQSETILNSQINRENMKLGAFSVSLNVRDINASKQFYENLGFTVFAGGMEKNYLIMKNENSLHWTVSGNV